PREAFLRHVDTAQGSVLAMLCLRPVKTHGADYYLIGGRKLDSVVQSLTPPAGLRVSIYSNPEQGQGEIIGPAKDNLPLEKLMPLVQLAMQQHDASKTIDWGPGLLQQELTLEKRIRDISLMIAGLGIFIAVLISAILTARMSRPIRDLADAAAEVGHG